ncbi:DUF4168 domain-containing protein [Erythrobacter arachoides]|uniref:DUF4168 domain-containing protein n=1 Tax=Aurantiacibacter arachoides TaxID=1850444 RepID=A0A845A3D9_9SPHN|nr:DUF4168 domain-containing protein [Aurantiacibacter arachoides]MXO92129.1 DUF4168 domain-containing protein [Aurantiacibacter arachoides]GGD59476.1 hypothetical protein GCM10011411_19600 [Aurantiacibacter arachoides]
MKTFAMLGAAGSLLFAGAAMAQELPAQAETSVTAATAFTDEQVDSFVDAAVAMRAAQAEIAADATVTAEARQARALEVLAQAGIEADTYNAIGAAMQSDPAVAQRVQLALGARAQAAQGNDNS